MKYKRKFWESIYKGGSVENGCSVKWHTFVRFSRLSWCLWHSILKPFIHMYLCSNRYIYRSGSGFAIVSVNSVELNLINSNQPMAFQALLWVTSNLHVALFLMNKNNTSSLTWSRGNWVEISSVIRCYNYVYV